MTLIAKSQMTITSKVNSWSVETGTKALSIMFLFLFSWAHLGSYIRYLPFFGITL